MLIALEGHSYSGKTTLLNYLKNSKNKNVIAEHDIYAGGIENYPPFPPTTWEMAKNNVDFFANLEIRRAQDAASLDGEIFFDRSFMSVILFQKFMKSLAISGQFDAYEYAKMLFSELLVSNKVAFPDTIAFVSCESEEEYKKRQSREISVGLLRSGEALRFFTEEYDRICSVFESHGRLMRLISKDGDESVEENAALLEKFSQKSLVKNDKRTIMTEIMEII